MSGTVILKVGNKGRVVVPADVRNERGWVEGTTLLGVSTDEGLLLISEDDALRRVHDQLAGRSLADELIAERRIEAQREDDESLRNVG